MPLDYSGVFSAAQSPSAAPGLTVIPDFRLPVSGEPVAVATSLYQWAKATADGLAYSWRTASGGFLAAILARANSWIGIQNFTNKTTFVGDLAGVQSDITPSINFDVLDAGTWKLVENASDSDNPTDAKPLRYVAGHGAPGPGAEAFVNNAVWNPAMGGTWSCIDTGAVATMRIQATQGFYWLSHAATASTWAQMDWTVQASVDASAGTIAGTTNVTAGTSISATTSVGAGTTVTAGTTLIGQKASLSVARSSATGGSGQAVAAGDVYKDTAAFGWATFTVNVGTGAPTLVRGANVATVAAGGGLGFYVVTMQTAATNILIPVVSSGSGTTRLFCDVTVISTTVINLTFRDAALAPQDPQYVNVIVFQG